MPKTLKRIGMLTLGLLTISSIHAAESSLTRTELKQIALLEAPVKSAEWNITEADWVKYREIMDGPRGIWSPNADPITVLGAHATSTAERNRLADAFVKLEYQRVLGELTFQQAVDAAWPRNFPNQQRVNTSQLISTNTKPTQHLLLASQVQRYALVVEDDCSNCDAKVSEYVSMMQKDSSSRMLDVFVRKTGSDDERLRNWVADSGIPIKLIQDGRITINHGDQYEQGTVPAVWVLRGDGQWKQLN